jgi:sucrose-6-phosphate hydrolase SacC (GH32 family)
MIRRPFRLGAAAAFLSTVSTALAQPRPDILIADFESETYGDWITTGDAFGPGPARGTLPNQMPVSGFAGRGLVNTFRGVDAGTGTLTSTPFKIERDHITFLIGGGKDLKNTAIFLVVDGQVVRTATGPNDAPGGSERLDLQAWNVHDLIGQSATIRIVDEARGPWGHINVDQIEQTDQPPAKALAPAECSFAIEHRYLNLPIKNGAPKRRVTLVADGRAQVSNDIELADADPDWWAPMDVGAFRRRTFSLQVDLLPGDSQALKSIQTSDAFPAANLYHEPLRPQFHFSPRRGWTNDPNGLAFFRGEYHLFFQHNPYGWNWGNMHWGHAVSTDMVHWQELGEALAPDPLGAMFSGSAVVDRDNTSGLGEPGRPPQVLIYTADGDPATQCLAFSTDGRAYTKFAGNPVLKQISPHNRDPKVFWHKPTGKWVMALYVEQAGTHTIQFFGSPNLKDWSFLSRTDGFFECPDIFELPEGDKGQTKWVLTAASAEYMIGSFDGTSFTPETPKLPGHQGRGFYAAQTFSDLLDGRRIQIGWFQTPTPGMPFNQSMTIPQELGVVRTPAGPRLTRSPVRELESLRARSHAIDPMILKPGNADPLAGIHAELIELRADIEPDNTSQLSLTIRGATIRYHAASQELVVNGLRSPAPLRDGRLTVTVYCDRTGLEVFASDGLTYVPMPFVPPADNLSLGLKVEGGNANIRTLQVHELKSAWPD